MIPFLSPCPFCGDRSRLELVRCEPAEDDDDFVYRVNCQNCGALGPNDKTAGDALCIWDEREIQEPIASKKPVRKVDVLSSVDIEHLLP